ncbi:PREDICTED: immunoglobulin superfamily member 11-like [Nanorana parkeri]|uniref:immunoglobulin superfamily member 11-like n=1 Tax=Nanorana parkeri TaxID=125878 RepID=UPI0008543AD5|nr:PREDICTED: immunoglobulin superfamily member 11-like [Nanorana parkeri]
MKSRLGLPLPWLLTLTAVSAVKVTINTPSVQVTRGGTALLPCSFRTTAALNRLNIIWTVTPLEEPKHPLQVIAYEQGQIVESLTEYLGRVRFAFQPTQDASIFINHTRVSDTGTYQCTVMNPPDGATPNIGLVGLTVLVPPSIPDCSSDGQGQEGGSIHLRCSVTEGIPTPRFRWEKMSPDGQLLISHQEDHRGSATLTNITLGTSGLYRCTATNQLGSQSCAIELRIHVGGIDAMGIFAAITITLIMGLVLLALFALVLCLHQQSRGKWREAELYDPTRVDNLSAGQLHVIKSADSDTGISSLIARPVSEPYIPPARPSPRILYSVRQSQINLSPVLETPHIRKHFPRLCSETDDSITESEEDDEDNTSPVSPPVYRSSLYSLNSGFLV